MEELGLPNLAGRTECAGLIRDERPRGRGGRERCTLRLATDRARGLGKAGSSLFPRAARLPLTACEAI
jgi:hypothetical protein